MGLASASRSPGPGLKQWSQIHQNNGDIVIMALCRQSQYSPVISFFFQHVFFANFNNIFDSVVICTGLGFASTMPRFKWPVITTKQTRATKSAPKIFLYVYIIKTVYNKCVCWTVISPIFLPLDNANHSTSQRYSSNLLKRLLTLT